MIDLMYKDTDNNWKSILDVFYPIGSLYFSANDTSPASFIGGSWAQMEPGNFLMTAGETYNVLSSGGENTHTLTQSELPRHTHTADMAWIENTGGQTITRGKFVYRGSGRTTAQPVWEVSSTGSNQPHNNMPKYIAVNIYYRTS